MALSHCTTKSTRKVRPTCRPPASLHGPQTPCLPALAGALDKRPLLIHLFSGRHKPVQPRQEDVMSRCGRVGREGHRHEHTHTHLPWHTSGCLLGSQRRQQIRPQAACRTRQEEARAPSQRLRPCLARCALALPG